MSRDRSSRQLLHFHVHICAMRVFYGSYNVCVCVCMCTFEVLMAHESTCSLNQQTYRKIKRKKQQRNNHLRFLQSKKRNQTQRIETKLNRSDTMGWFGLGSKSSRALAGCVCKLIQMEFLLLGTSTDYRKYLLSVLYLFTSG